MHRSAIVLHRFFVDCQEGRPPRPDGGGGGDGVLERDVGTVVPRRSLADPNSAVAAGGVAGVGLSLGVSARYADIIPPLAILACPRRVGGKWSDAAAWCELKFTTR